MSKEKIIFDENFNYKGYIDEKGNIMGPGLDYQGHIDEEGHVYGVGFDYKGRIDKNGSVYGPGFDYKGTIGKNGMTTQISPNLTYKGNNNVTGMLGMENRKHVSSYSEPMTSSYQFQSTFRPAVEPDKDFSMHFGFGVLSALLLAGGALYYLFKYLSIMKIIGSLFFGLLVGLLASGVVYVLCMIPGISAPYKKKPKQKRVRWYLCAALSAGIPLLLVYLSFQYLFHLPVNDEAFGLAFVGSPICMGLLSLYLLD